MSETGIEGIDSYLKSESGETLLLITMATAYPILAEKAGGFSLPVAICFQNEEQMRDFAALFRFFGVPPIKTLAEPPKAVIATIGEARGGVVLYRLLCGRYTEENLQSIANAMGVIEYGNPCMNLHIVMAEKNIPACYREFFSGFIFMAPTSNETEKKLIKKRNVFQRALIEYVIEIGQKDLPVDDYETENFEPDMKIFLAARHLLMNFLRDYCHGENESGQFGEALLESVEKIEREWSYAGEAESYAEAFRNLLLEESTRLSSEMLNRLAVQGKDMDKMGEAIFYDNEAYYFYLTDLERICRPLLKSVSFDYLKNQLVDAGILVAEGRRRLYYTKKIEIVTEYGFVVQKRLSKIKRDKIDLPGELTFLEKMIQRRKENDSEIGADSRGIGMDKDFGE